jgi:hypothetical protein
MDRQHGDLISLAFLCLGRQLKREYTRRWRRRVKGRAKKRTGRKRWKGMNRIKRRE